MLVTVSAEEVGHRASAVTPLVPQIVLHRNAKPKRGLVTLGRILEGR